jgi:ankyrin repeat protein
MWSIVLQSGESALYLACYQGNSEIVSLLLKAGARTDIQEEVAIAQSAFDWLYKQAICDKYSVMYRVARLLSIGLL